MKVVRILATLSLTGALAATTGAASAATPHSADATIAAAGRTANVAAAMAPAGAAVPRREERAVVLLPGAGQMPVAVWLPTEGHGTPSARPTGADHFTKASAWTPESGLSGGSLASLTAGALTAAAASLLVATRRHRSRRR